MRIPLDYYQILGVSFDATPEQIQQSYEDRLQQLPKQQYSAAAIASRKKLLLEAHSILLNPKRRQEHDQSLFPDIDQPYDAPSGDSATALFDRGVEVDSNFLAGALILLLEFGEFQSVLELGMTHLNRPIDLKKMPDEVGPVDDDVALAVSIANLELGREHWQQGDCEDAGQCLQSGLKILREEGKFLDIQTEIETDLSKLRPYRVLDLLALEEADPKRAEGLSLLQDMLDERGGMEGSGDDQSGLSVNDFLLFMQQLRENLTVDEQFNLFRAESMRPSSVATYLSAYAHIARGVSEKEPAFVSQANALLASLADRQDLSLEQGMCSLLLGQPDAASHCVQKSTDEEAIAFITDYSEGAPDIIPGLYLYTEQWLQLEVYPYFRNLNDQTVSLEEYFNDEKVQRELSELEPDLPNLDSAWQSNSVDAKWERWLMESTQVDSADETKSLADSESSTFISGSTPISEEELIEETSSPSKTSWFSALTSPKADSGMDESIDTAVPKLDVTELKWAKEAYIDPEGDLLEVSQPQVSDPRKKKKRGGQSNQKPGWNQGELNGLNNIALKETQTHQRDRLGAKKKPWIIWGATLLLAITAGWGVLAIGRLLNIPPNNAQTPETQPNGSGFTEPEGSEPRIPSPPSSAPGESKPNNSVANSGDLTKAGAQEIILKWQKIKSEALGSSHKLDSLEQILIEPALSRWVYSADIAQKDGEYTTYELKNLEILSVTVESPTKALVQAKVSESRNQYKTGVEAPFATIVDDMYNVTYHVESVDGKWRIKEMDLQD